MKESAWGYLILVLGIAIVIIMILIQNITSTSEEDFYLTREILEASMYDAVDYGTYTKSGKLVMSEQKFVEVFLRRFAESVKSNKTYKIDFYDIHEYPPKATVLIKTNTGETSVASDTVNININTYLSAILETVATYNEERIVPRGTPLYSEKGELSTTTSNDTKVILNFQFLAENDPCEYYRFIEKDESGIVTGKMVFKKDSKYGKVQGIGDYDRTKEYCNVRTESMGTNGSKVINNYFVEKSVLKK